MKTSYYTLLWYNPRLEIRYILPLLKKIEKTGETIKTKSPLHLKTDYYNISISLILEKDAIDNLLYLTLITKDEEDGDAQEQKIYIHRQKNPLVDGAYNYYFEVGHRAKKLYLIGRFWQERRSFFHRYSGQRMSHYDRSFNRMEDPYRRYGKFYYRGKLTPYGKRIIRYSKSEEREEKAIIEFVRKFR